MGGLGCVEMEAALNSDIDRLLDRRDAPVKWVCDDDVSDCTRCASSFGLFNRKHHCRRCGKVFCDDCSSNEIELPGYTDHVRVCQPCFDVSRGGLHQVETDAAFDRCVAMEEAEERVSVYDLHSKLAELRTGLTDKEDEMRYALVHKDSEMAQLKTTIAEEKHLHEQTIAALRDMQAEKDALIAEKDAALRDMQAEKDAALQDMQAQLTSRDQSQASAAAEARAELVHLKSQLSAMVSECEVMQHEAVAEYESAIITLASANIAEKLADLESELAGMNSLRAEIETGLRREGRKVWAHKAGDLGVSLVALKQQTTGMRLKIGELKTKACAQKDRAVERWSSKNWTKPI